ncbi:MAG TPA: hypothetical protein PKM73_15835 [Verrucomicrobiota bacterium]|nr:hypothetical protein [Verrucomicrobiota bacterium]
MLQKLKPLVAALLFLAPGFGLCAAPPDVLLIISDDQHWGDYGFMGHPTIRTPHEHLITGNEPPRPADLPGLGLAHESAPVRFVGPEQADTTHDGGLRWAIGVKSWQALRANRSHPELADGFGWTYNHAPMLAYGRNRFWIEYLSAPVHENRGPMHTLLMSSTNGIHWEKPRVVFPEYRTADDTIFEVHQRMGFYVAPDGRLLVLGFYGPERKPNEGGGIGRTVREVYADGTFGPIYFIRYSRHNGWNESNTSHPFYTASPDEGFKRACQALLANKLVTLQWWEEDRAKDGFYPDLGDQVLKALSFYHRKDGAAVALWKNSWTALSTNNGLTWSQPAQEPSLVTASGKVWGQRTPDGRYALVYNPTRDNRHRWPLALVTGDDGETFDQLLTVVGEVPPRRYNGLDKAFGPQYVRGIVEGNGKPPGNAFWITWSMNKDDIWVSRIPVPVRATVNGPVHDDFNTGALEDLPWNLHSPLWAGVRLAAFPSATNRSLELRDREPADYARAVRVLPAMKRATVRFKVLARQTDHGRLEIELLDRYGYRPTVVLIVDEQGRMLAKDGNQHEIVTLKHHAANQWYDVALRFDLERGVFDVILDGQTLLAGAEIGDPTAPVERISFRTGEFRTSPTLRDPKSPGADLPNADQPVPEAAYYIDDVSVSE